MRDHTVSFNVFIDTEFTDFLDPQLISIGLVAQSGEEFYAELPYEVRECSEFVKAAVLPLLGYAPHAEMTKDELYLQMTNWLRLVRPKDQEVFICYDYQTDWDLFYDALDGACLHGASAGSLLIASMSYCVTSFIRNISCLSIMPSMMPEQIVMLSVKFF
jgi:hypothetical protein